MSSPSSSSPPLDLSGVLNVQSNYLADLRYYYGNDSNITGVTNALNEIKGNLTSMHVSLQSGNGSAQSILDTQTKMQDIITRETNRLNAKKASIDDALTTTRRVTELSDSNRKFQSEYINVLILFTAVVFVYIVLVQLQNVLPFLSSITPIVAIVLFSVVAIYAIQVYLKVLKRDPNNYDKLALPSMSKQSLADIMKAQQSAIERGDLSAAVKNPNICSGPLCCSDNSLWEEGVQKCVSKCPVPASGQQQTYAQLDAQYKEGSTLQCFDTVPAGYKKCGNVFIPTAATCYKREGFTGLENQVKTKVNPYQPSEYSKYSQVK
jgi:hypothetical protein